MPTCAASSTRWPTLTPCAMCTRLSILVPARIRVSPTAGRSIVELAPISTSSSMTTSAVLRDLQMRAVGLLREPEAVAADHGAVVQDDAVADDHALADRDVRVDDAVVADPGAGADDDVGIDDGAGADGRAGADRDERPDRDVGANRARRPRRCSADRRPAAAATAARTAPRPARTRGTACRCAARRSAAPRRIAWAADRITADARVVPSNEHVPGVGHERQIAGLRVLDARHAEDLDVAGVRGGAAFEAALQLVGQVAKLHQRACCAA